MSTRKSTATLGLILALAGFSAGQPAKPTPLSLEECILRAIKYNAGVTVEILNPEIAALSVAQAREKFLPTLSFSYNREQRNSASYSWIESSDRMTIAGTEYSARISQVIPTGGTVSVSLDAYSNETNARFQTINPRYGSTLNFSFSQPLLKDFGFKASRQQILVARNNSRISENDFKDILLETVYEVERAYWNLVLSIESLKVQELSLHQAEELLEKNRKEIAIGTMAPREILSAEAEVARRRTDILQAVALVKDYKDQVRTLINLEDDVEPVDIVPSDQPLFEKRDVSFEGAVAAAAKNRPDLMASRIDIENRALELSYARNQLLPALNLNAGYWSPGLSGTRILYLNDNPLTGVILGKIAGESSEALKDALNFKYRNWSLSLSLDVPLNTVFTRAAVARAKLSHDQSARRLKYAEQKALLEIRTAVRAVETDYQRVESSRIAGDLARRKLEAEEAKLKAGLSSNFFILEYQKDLAQARVAELMAIIDYRLSLARLDKAMGVSLDARNIKLAGASQDAGRDSAGERP
ncbi:MAG: TolC family protein [Acidobacteriota bacterium]|nr:TolC family protein [Acidobacteriota bacterium]